MRIFSTMLFISYCELTATFRQVHCEVQPNHGMLYCPSKKWNWEGGRQVEVLVCDRVASLPQVKGNLASRRESEEKGRKKGKGRKRMIWVYLCNSILCKAPNQTATQPADKTTSRCPYFKSPAGLNAGSKMKPSQDEMWRCRIMVYFKTRNETSVHYIVLHATERIQCQKKRLSSDRTVVKQNKTTNQTSIRPIITAWHWLYLTVLNSGKQGLTLLQALHPSSVKLLVTLPWANTHTEWKSKAIPPWIKLCRWSNGLPWWQGTIISSKEVKAADWRMKNTVQSRVGDGTKKDSETPRDWLQFSIYDKSTSLSFVFSASFFRSPPLFPCLDSKKAAHLADSVQSNDLSIIARPMATTHWAEMQ